MFQIFPDYKLNMSINAVVQKSAREYEYYEVVPSQEHMNMSALLYNHLQQIYGVHCTVYCQKFSYEHQTVLTSSEITLIMYCTVNLFYCETFPDAMTMGPCMYRPCFFFSDHASQGRCTMRPLKPNS